MYASWVPFVIGVHYINLCRIEHELLKPQSDGVSFATIHIINLIVNELSGMLRSRVL